MINFNKKIQRIALAMIFLFISWSNALAQCAMCRATMEGNVSDGEIGIADSLNVGILYLFATPYLVILVIGVLWYKSSKRNAGKKSIASYSNI